MDGVGPDAPDGRVGEAPPEQRLARPARPVAPDHLHVPRGEPDDGAVPQQLRPGGGLGGNSIEHFWLEFLLEERLAIPF